MLANRSFSALFIGVTGSQFSPPTSSNSSLRSFSASTTENRGRWPARDGEARRRRVAVLGGACARSRGSPHGWPRDTARPQRPRPAWPRRQCVPRRRPPCTAACGARRRGTTRALGGEGRQDEVQAGGGGLERQKQWWRRSFGQPWQRHIILHAR